MMPGEACNYLQVNDMDSSSEFPLEDQDNLRIILDEFEQLDFANSNTFEQFVKDTDACSDFFSEKFPHCIVRNKRIANLFDKL